MNAQIALSNCTLSTEDQAVVDAVNEFLAWLPDDVDHEPALRLAMMMLEAADVASQDPSRVIGTESIQTGTQSSQRKHRETQRKTL